MKQVGRGGWRLSALLLALVQAPVLVRTGADPSQSDFANYLTPAIVLARGGDVGTLYDREAFDQAMSRTGIPGLGSFIPHPPANALWLVPLAGRPPAVAKALWSGVLVLAILFTIVALARLDEGFSPSLSAVLVLAPTLAVRNGLAFGQPYLILAALLAAGVVALDRGRDFLAGFLLGLGVSFKPYALWVGALFLRRDRKHALVGFLCGAALPSVFLWIVAGEGPFIEFKAKVLPWMLKGDIQDPFSPVWGSASALFNRLFRFEPDLNPDPWLVAPGLARFLGAAVPAALLAVGVLAGRRAIEARRALDAVAICIAFALAASPFAASYHLVLLSIPFAALAARSEGRARVLTLAGYALLGSSSVHAFRAATGPLAPLAYARFFAMSLVAFAVAWPFLRRGMRAPVLAAGALAGFLAVSAAGATEPWSRIEAAKGYSMMRPYFCGERLRWLSPAADGRRLESRGEGEDCAPIAAPRAARVESRFTEGSWNLYLHGTSAGLEQRLTYSSANELEPVPTPDGCGVVFASDQGRGLGSTALYRIEVPALKGECAGAGPASSRP